MDGQSQGGGGVTPELFWGHSKAVVGSTGLRVSREACREDSAPAHCGLGADSGCILKNSQDLLKG